MVFISMDVNAPKVEYRFTHDIRFTKIKVTEFIIQTNNINIPNVDNLLLCINDFNDNHHIFNITDGNALNTQYLADIPYVSGSAIGYAPVNMYPPDYHNRDGKAERFFKVSLKKPNGEAISLAEWGSTSAHMILWFE